MLKKLNNYPKSKRNKNSNRLISKQNFNAINYKIYTLKELAAGKIQILSGVAIIVLKKCISQLLFCKFQEKLFRFGRTKYLGYSKLEKNLLEYIFNFSRSEKKINTLKMNICHMLSREFFNKSFFQIVFFCMYISTSILNSNYCKEKGLFQKRINYVCLSFRILSRKFFSYDSLHLERLVIKLCIFFFLNYEFNQIDRESINFKNKLFIKLGRHNCAWRFWAEFFTANGRKESYKRNTVGEKLFFKETISNGNLNFDNCILVFNFSRKRLKAEKEVYRKIISSINDINCSLNSVNYLINFDKKYCLIQQLIEIERERKKGITRLFSNKIKKRLNINFFWFLYGNFSKFLEENDIAFTFRFKQNAIFAERNKKDLWTFKLLFSKNLKIKETIPEIGLMKKLIRQKCKIKIYRFNIALKKKNKISDNRNFLFSSINYHFFKDPINLSVSYYHELTSNQTTYCNYEEKGIKKPTHIIKNVYKPKTGLEIKNIALKKFLEYHLPIFIYLLLKKRRLVSQFFHFLNCFRKELFELRNLNNSIHYSLSSKEFQNHWQVLFIFPVIFWHKKLDYFFISNFLAKKTIEKPFFLPHEKPRESLWIFLIYKRKYPIKITKKYLI